MQLAVESDWGQLLFLIIFLLFSMLGRVLNWLVKRKGAAGGGEPDASTAAQGPELNELEEYFEALERDEEPEPIAVERMTSEPVQARFEPSAQPVQPARPVQPVTPPVNQVPESLVSLSDTALVDSLIGTAPLAGDRVGGKLRGSPTVDAYALSAKRVDPRVESLRSAMLWFHILGAPVSLRDPGAPDAPVGLR